MLKLLNQKRLKSTMMEREEMTLWILYYDLTKQQYWPLNTLTIAIAIINTQLQIDAGNVVNLPDNISYNDIEHVSALASQGRCAPKE